MSVQLRVVRKPVELDAVQFDGSLANRQFLIAWVTDPVSGRGMLATGERMYVPTQDGTVVGELGDWVLKGLQGEFYTCKADAFEALYTVVDGVADEPAVLEEVEPAPFVWPVFDVPLEGEE